MECIKTEDLFKKLDKVRSYTIKNKKYYMTEDIIKLFIKSIKDAMSFDAEPVVRCKDCKHSRERNKEERKYLIEGILICTSCDACNDCDNAVFPEHYCSYGER